MQLSPLVAPPPDRTRGVIIEPPHTRDLAENCPLYLFWVRGQFIDLSTCMFDLTVSKNNPRTKTYWLGSLSADTVSLPYNAVDQALSPSIEVDRFSAIAKVPSITFFLHLSSSPCCATYVYIYMVRPQYYPAQSLPSSKAFLPQLFVQLPYAIPWIYTWLGASIGAAVTSSVVLAWLIVVVSRSQTA